MQTGVYRFHCQFSTEALLPEFKGSMLRGAFGHALKKTVCALRRAQCTDCLLAASCGYAFIFEVAKTVPDNGHGRPRVAARPHPFVLVSPHLPQRFFKAGDGFNFGLTLFGRANDYLPHVVYAVEQMGESGLGRDAKKGQGRFRLEAVESQGAVIYDRATKILHQPASLPRLGLEQPPPAPAESVGIKLLTPLRLKHQNQLQDSLPFHLLIRTALRRISTLSEAYGGGEPDLDYSGLIRRAEKVEIADSDCRWVDLKRFSNRQKSAMLLGGLEGHMTYAGEVGEFLPLLRFCEITNLGKQTAFGLGRIGLSLT